MNDQFIKDQFDDLATCVIGTSSKYHREIGEFADMLVKAIFDGKKVLLAGNGGSASEATHIAAEFTGRFKRERKGWPAISLTADQSAVTSIANDYGYENVFSRQVEALGQEGDVLVVLSTSGNSDNLVEALNRAKSDKIKTVSLLGKTGGKMSGISDLEMIIPSEDTARIQEVHLLILHIMCDLVECKLTVSS